MFHSWMRTVQFQLSILVDTGGLFLQKQNRCTSRRGSENNRCALYSPLIIPFKCRSSPRSLRITVTNFFVAIHPDISSVNLHKMFMHEGKNFTVYFYSYFLKICIFTLNEITFSSTCFLTIDLIDLIMLHD